MSTLLRIADAFGTSLGRLLKGLDEGIYSGATQESSPPRPSFSSEPPLTAGRFGEGTE